MNTVRVRDIVAMDSNTFDVHKLEHVKASTKGSSESSKGGLAMTLECTSESEKNEWVKAINNVVKGIECREKRQIKIWIL